MNGRSTISVAMLRALVTTVIEGRSERRGQVGPRREPARGGAGRGATVEADDRALRHEVRGERRDALLGRVAAGLLVADRQVVGDRAGHHATVRAGDELLGGQVAEVAPHGGLGDPERLHHLGHAEPAVLGQQPQQGAPAGAAVHAAAVRLAHLTAPEVRPPTRCFSISANSTTTGTIAMIEAPKSWSQFCS